MKLLLLIWLIAITLASKVGEVQFDVLAVKKCNKNGPWSIHGWWPEYTVSKWPQWCNSRRYHEFNETIIGPIQKELNSYWYSCPGWPSAYRMWIHEWEKHGTCTDDTVLEYFNTALTAFHIAGYNNWYHCCNHATQQCLIPFKKDTTEWLGWCDTSGTHMVPLVC